MWAGRQRCRAACTWSTGTISVSVTVILSQAISYMGLKGRTVCEGLWDKGKLYVPNWPFLYPTLVSGYSDLQFDYPAVNTQSSCLRCWSASCILEEATDPQESAGFSWFLLHEMFEPYKLGVRKTTCIQPAKAQLTGQKPELSFGN